LNITAAPKDIEAELGNAPFDEKTCLYCGSANLRRVYEQLYNKRKPDYGPFDFYVCEHCGSGLTLPPPTAEALSALYQHLEHGMSALTRALLQDNPEAAWHRMCVDRLVQLSGCGTREEFTWMDIGAGAGEIAAELGRRFPSSTGLAIDIHECPPALCSNNSNVIWKRIDISNDHFSRDINFEADIVFATGVWEHVRHPDVFARNAIALMKPRSMLYMTTPNYSSLARRLLGRRWPYFFPGEHLCMPTPRGARLCLQREVSITRGPEVRVQILTRPILISYSLRYVFTKFGMPSLARLMPRSASCRLPSGAMESILWLNT